MTKKAHNDLKAPHRELVEAFPRLGRVYEAMISTDPRVALGHLLTEEPEAFVMFLEALSRLRPSNPKSVQSVAVGQSVAFGLLAASDITRWWEQCLDYMPWEAVIPFDAHRCIQFGDPRRGPLAPQREAHVIRVGNLIEASMIDDRSKFEAFFASTMVVDHNRAIELLMPSREITWSIDIAMCCARRSLNRLPNSTAIYEAWNTALLPPCVGDEQKNFQLSDTMSIRAVVREVVLGARGESRWYDSLELQAKLRGEQALYAKFLTLMASEESAQGMWHHLALSELERPATSLRDTHPHLVSLMMQHPSKEIRLRVIATLTSQSLDPVVSKKRALRR